MFSMSMIRQPIRILFVCSAGWIIVRVSYCCYAYLCEEQMLTTTGHTHLHAMLTDTQVLGRGCTWKMSANAYDVAIWCRDTAFHH